MRRLIALTAAILGMSAAIAGTATAAAPNYSDALSQFMCTSCHEPLELVNSPQAISEKQWMRHLLAEGLDMSQLKKAMVAQYGQQVLARPPASGFNLTVYILPPAIFLAGLALLASHTAEVARALKTGDAPGRRRPASDRRRQAPRRRARALHLSPGRGATSSQAR